MSVRFTAASSQEYTSTSPINMNADFTACGWAYIVGGTSGAFFSVLFDANNGEVLYFTQVGGANKLTLLSAVGGVLNIPGTTGATTISAATWVHVAIVRSGSNVSAYLNAVSEVSGTSAVGGRSAATQMELAASNTGTFLDGRLYGWKMYSSALSPAELANDMNMIRPAQASVARWYPFLSPDTLDWSGNGATLTASGTPTTEDPPPVSWGGSSRFVTIVPAAGGVTVLPGVGGLTIAGFSPTIGTPVTVTPGVGSVLLAGLAPTIGTPVTVAPGVGGLVLAGFSPTIGTPVTILPGVGSLLLGGFAPTIGTPVTILPGLGALLLAGFAPVIGTPVTVLPGFGQLILAGFPPTIGTPVTVLPGKGGLLLAGFAPTINGASGVVAVLILRKGGD